MRIDGTHGPDGSQAPSARGAGKPAQPAPSLADALAPAGEAPIKGLSLDQVRNALAAADASADRVAKAKAMLASGELDTPEAARRAAESIVKFGL